MTPVREREFLEMACQNNHCVEEATGKLNKPARRKIRQIWKLKNPGEKGRKTGREGEAERQRERQSKVKPDYT